MTHRHQILLLENIGNKQLNEKLSYDIISHSDQNWREFTEIYAKNIFHHPAWLEVLSESYDYQPLILVVKSEGRIRAGLPFLVSRRLISRYIWKSLPFTDYITPLYDSAEALQNLYGALEWVLEEQQASDIEVRHKVKSEKFHPISDEVLYVLELRGNEEKMMSKIHNMHRRNIKKAQENGVTIRQSTSLQSLKVFYRFHVETRRGLGIPVQPWYFFEQFHQKLIQRGLGFILSAVHEGEIVSSAVFLNWKDTLTYKYGASNREKFFLRSNNLLFWEAIRWGLKNGYRMLDFGKSHKEDEGLCTYKSRWGAEEFPLCYSYAKPPGSRFRKLIFPVMKKTIQTLPEYYCILMGVLLYRRFG